MEERPPTSNDTKNTLPPPPGPAALETYVVQIPRDQIYRVPPPEHARIVEEHKQRISTNQEPNCRNIICSYVIPVIVFAIIAGITFATFRATLYRPAKPEFAITGIQGKNFEEHSHGTSHPPEFKIMVKANNRNTRMSVSYMEGGLATLVFKDKKIGEGKIPSTIKAGTSGAADFAVVLVDNGPPLTKEIKTSLNDVKEKSMEVKMELPVEMNSWMRNERMNMKISCDFRVHNSLTNTTRISFQECTTNF